MLGVPYALLVARFGEFRYAYGLCEFSFSVRVERRGERPIGLLVSLWVYLVYAIALQFEGCVKYLVSI